MICQNYSHGEVLLYRLIAYNETSNDKRLNDYYFI